jgi:steroid delta-isomerase-like uncharacterized protein
MASKNVATVKALLDAFNSKNLSKIGASYSEQCVLIDHARSETVKGRTAVAQNWEMWATAFPDGQCEEPHYVDGGESVVVQFVGRGTNSGPIGPMPKTGKRISLPYCSVFAFDADGKIIGQDDYWDQLGFLVQLGVLEAPQM